jgi:DNA-binding MarR family transcriptional regulator
MDNPVRAAADEDTIRPAQIPAMPADLHAHLPYLLNRLSNRWNIDINRDLSEQGINNTVLRTLSVLYIHKTLTVNEIASYAVVEQSNASRTIDTMVTAGLVKRQIAANDLRRREIGLTDKGEALLRQLWPIMVRNHEKLIEGIPEKDLKVCLDTLLAMIGNIGEPI